VTEADEPYSYYENGVPFIISEGDEARITLGPAVSAQDADDRQLFFIEIVNLSDKPFNFGPNNLSVVTSQGEEVAVLTPEKLQREANRAANWLAFSSAIQQASNSYDAAGAGYSSGTASYSGRTNYYGSGGYGSATTYGTALYSSYNGGAAAHARLAANAENRAIRAEYSERIANLLRTAQDGALKNQTVRPRDRVSSLVLIENIPGNATVLSVRSTAANEIHDFSWNYFVE
jgi:hypothetical protein